MDWIPPDLKTQSGILSVSNWELFVMDRAIQRRVMRYLHVAGALILGIYLYSPWGGSKIFQQIVQFGVFPILLAFTGLFMWKPGLLRKK